MSPHIQNPGYNDTVQTFADLLDAFDDKAQSGEGFGEGVDVAFERREVTEP
jgi:hypothetical protein